MERVPLVVAETLDGELFVAETGPKLPQARVIEPEQVQFRFLLILLGRAHARRLPMRFGVFAPSSQFQSQFAGCRGVSLGIAKLPNPRKRWPMTPGDTRLSELESVCG